MPTTFSVGTDMEEHYLEFLPLRVVSVGANGKRRFDPQGKQKLIAACLEPGVSVASMALKAHVNANQLWRWIKKSQSEAQTHGVSMAVEACESGAAAFVPVKLVGDGAPRLLPPQRDGSNALPVSQAGASLSSPRLVVQLPNGIQLEVQCGAQDTAWMRMVVDALRVS